MKKSKGGVFFSTLIIVLFAVQALLFGTGCSAGSKVNTDLQIDRNFKGQRVMEVAIDSSSFSSNFKGTTDNLNNIIAANCPADMEYAIPTDGSNKYVFTIKFANKAEYERKVKNITGLDIEVEFAVPDTVFASGVYLEENFTTEDILQWLKDAVVYGGYVADSNSGYIFGSGNNYITFEGEQIDTGYSYLGIDTKEMVYIDEIIIKTVDNGSDDNYDRVITFNIDKYSLEPKADDVDKFFRDIAKKENLEVSKKNNNDFVIYELEKDGLDIAGIDAMDKAVFGEGNSCKQFEGFEFSSPFSIYRGFVEEYDITGFVGGNYSYGTMIRRTMEYPDGFGEHKDGSRVYAYSPDGENYPSALDVEDGAYSVDTDRSYDVAGQAISIIGKNFPVNDADIKFNSLEIIDSLKVTAAFEIQGDPSDDELALIEENFKSRFSPEEDAEEAEAANEESKAIKDTEDEEPVVIKPAKSKVSIGKTKAGNKLITVTLSGKHYEVRKSAREGGLYIDFVRTNEGGPFKVNRKTMIDCSVDLFWKYFIDEVSGDYMTHITYNIGVGAKEIRTSNYDGGQFFMGTNKSSKTVSDTELYLRDTWYGTYVDMWALMFWILSALGIAVIAFAFIFQVVKNRPKRAAAPVGYAPGPQMGQPWPGQPVPVPPVNGQWQQPYQQAAPMNQPYQPVPPVNGQWQPQPAPTPVVPVAPQPAPVPPVAPAPVPVQPVAPTPMSTPVAPVAPTPAPVQPAAPASAPTPAVSVAPQPAAPVQAPKNFGFCMYCGAPRISAEDRFCEKCGKPF